MHVSFTLLSMVAECLREECDGGLGHGWWWAAVCGGGAWKGLGHGGLVPWPRALVVDELEC